MVAALSVPGPLLCLQLDRFYKDDHGNMSKLDHTVGWFAGCHFPIFTDGSLSWMHKNYFTIAVVAHLGDCSSGHYQTLLRSLQTFGEDGNPWILVDDHQSMCGLQSVPSQFWSQVSLIWLVEADKVNFYDPNWIIGTTATAISDEPTLLEILAQAS